MIKCPDCGSSQRQRKGIDSKGHQIYRCKNCLRQYTKLSKPKTTIPSKIEISCIQCGKHTTNPKFCSRGCAAIYNNRVHIKRKRKIYYCKQCGVDIGGRRRLCDDCMPDRSMVTVGEIRQRAKYQKSAEVRNVARRAFRRSGRPYVCQNCGYDKHVEVCHIKAVEDFPLDTLLAVVSGIDNLIALCPNCHWEFDHGLLTIDDILRKKHA